MLTDVAARCWQDASCDAANRGLNESFKWLFYGDDDTVFFLEGAMNVVKDLDPNMPYFLTGAPCPNKHLHHRPIWKCTPTTRHLIMPSLRSAATSLRTAHFACIYGGGFPLLQHIETRLFTVQTTCGSLGTWPCALATHTRGRPSAHPAATGGTRLGCRSPPRTAAPAE